jgi:hypothetical protein
MRFATFALDIVALGKEFGVDISPNDVPESPNIGLEVGD